MKIKQTVSTIALILGLAGVTAVLATVPASAENCGNGLTTSVLPCETGGESGVWGILLLIINIMSGGVGILAVAGLVYGSIMYSSAGGNAERLKKARSILTNVGIGLVAYALMFALLNFIIPGGIFK